MNRCARASSTSLLSALLGACCLITVASAQPTPPDPSPYRPDPGAGLVVQASSDLGHVLGVQFASPPRQPPPAPEDAPPAGPEDLVIEGRGVPGMKVEALTTYKNGFFHESFKKLHHARVSPEGNYMLHIPKIPKEPGKTLTDIHSIELTFRVPRDGAPWLDLTKAASSDWWDPSTISFGDIQMLIASPVRDELVVMKNDGRRTHIEDFLFFYFEKGRPGSHRIDIAIDAPPESGL